MKNSFKIATGAVVMAAMLITPLSQEASAERGSWMPIEVNIDGKLLDLPVDPIEQSGTTLVPMRTIFEALGAKVKWDNKVQKVTGTKGSTTVELTIGSKTAKLKGKASQLAVAPKIINGSTMIPLRYVSESLDMHVAWVASERQVYIAKDRTIEGTTMASVEALYNKYAPIFKGARFSEQPSYKAPYKAGKLSEGFLQDGLKAANFVREMAGLPALILDSKYNELSNYGAVLMMSATDSFLNHHPSQPADMNDDFYERGHSATASSNIHFAGGKDEPIELVESVRGFMVDQDTATLGHRRHILNPKLYKIGFGHGRVNVDQNISTTTLMYINDFSQPTSKDYDYIAWPSKGYFPISWLNIGTAFSLNLNPDKYQSLDTTKVIGTITNLVNGSVQKLVYGQTPGFYIHFDKYGEGQAISFFPYNGNEFFNVPNPGDEFVIELSGIYKADGTPATIKYTVKLFAM